MERYIAVDAGKFAVKACEYQKEEDKVVDFTFQTKMSDGDFRDDALEKNTYLAEVNGVTYKIGNGARGTGADLETSKATDIHRICTMFAISHFCSADEIDTVNIAVGLPCKEWAVVAKREDFREYMFAEKDITITIKESSSEEPVTKHFVINRTFVFPESIGALFQDDSPKIHPSTYVGVLDIGNLNLNASVWLGGELIQDDTITDELGGSTIVQGLSQELSATFSRCSEGLVAQLIAKKPENRYLTPANKDKEVMENSKLLIDKYLLEHAKKIKRCCDGRKWSLDYMKLIAIGGGSTILKTELMEVFGENLTILSCPSFANAYGYLRMECSRIPEIGKVIPLPQKTKKETAGKE